VTACAGAVYHDGLGQPGLSGMSAADLKGLAIHAGRQLFGAVAAERERWVLWLPVGLGLGIALYFGLRMEPPWWAGVAALPALATAAWTVRHREGAMLGFLAAATVAAGFAAAQVRAALVAAPVLADRHGPATVTGRVVAVEAFPDGPRVTLDRLRVNRLRPDLTPERARIKLRRGGPSDLRPGDWITLAAMLTPPPAPAAPGAFDFQRHAYFQGIGAVGFAVGKVQREAEAKADGPGGFELWLADLRASLTGRILAALGGGATGGMTAALITGDRAAIPEPVMEAMRDSGLAHIISISGLHIGLAAGTLFLAIRSLLALVPVLALRFPIKKWAATAALAGAWAYAALAGMTAPTLRSFLMMGLVLLAVLLDRRAISMRSLAWVGVAILLVLPESMVGPSFQMSFAAVAALIAAYEVQQARRRSGPEVSRRMWRPLAYFAAVGLTTLVAGLATGPFAAYHFNRFAVYGVLANMAAVPLTAVWIMPWAVAALLLTPFGLEGLALVPMGLGVDGLVWIAGAVAALPGAAALLPATPAWGLGLVSLGLAWLCIWQRRLRLLGLAAVVAGLSAPFATRPPDVLVDGEGRLMAARLGDGRLALSSPRAARYARDVWLRRAGEEAEAWATWETPDDGDAAPTTEVSSGARRLTCDGLGCIYRADGQTIALVRRPEALLDDCRLADVVVSLVPVRGRCPSARAVVDRFDLWRDGAHALWVEEGGVRIESVNDHRGLRPWVVRPGGRRS
jgi:competence protein ComEC